MCHGGYRNHSCSDVTLKPPARWATIASAAAFKPEIVVMMGIPRATAEVRIRQPSSRGPEPKGVFTTSETVPDSMRSSAVLSPLGPGPSENLRTFCTTIPLSARAFAVPAVAYSS